MFEKIVIRNYLGVHYVTIRNHDATGTDYTHCYKLTNAQARGLAEGGEDFLFAHGFPERENPQPVLLNLRDGDLYVGEDRLGPAWGILLEQVPVHAAEDTITPQ